MVAPYVPIQDIVPWNQFIAGLNQFIYSTNWTADDSTDILVYSRLSNIPASDILQLVDPSNYTVQFIGSGNVVQVTFLPLNNPPQYSIVTIMRNTPSQFLNSYTNTNFTPSMLNSDFENLVQVDQQNQLYWQQIVPRYNNSATLNVPVDTILPVLGASQFWAKNSSNTAFIPVDLSEEGGSGAPTSAPYLIYSPAVELSDAFNIGTLTSGILAHNSALNVSSPYSIPIPMDVIYGGTGLDSITPFAVLTGGGTSELPIVPIADLGGVGYVFTSAGAGEPPSWQPLPAVVDVLPVGSIIDFAGTAAPTSYLVCDGSSYDTGVYAALFSVIGYTWGGSGANFNVPNLQGFVTAGSGGSLPPLTNTVGSTGGAATHTIIIDEMPNHNHPGSTAAIGQTGTGSSGHGISGTNNGPTAVTVTPQGGSSPMTIVQPTAIVLKCIKYQ
jgi:microcystin-dependent protein